MGSRCCTQAFSSCDKRGLSPVQRFAPPWTVAHQGFCPWDFQTRILEWVAISSSRGSSWLREWTCVSWVSFTGRILYQKSLTDNRRQQNSQRSDHSTVCAVFLGYPQGIGSRTLLLLLLLLSRFSRVWLCATPETAAHQAPPSLGFSRQEQTLEWVAIEYQKPLI